MVLHEMQVNVLNHQVYKIVYGQRYSKRLSERQITTPLYFRFVHLATIHFAHFMLLQTVTHNAYSQDPYVKEFRIKFSQKLASVEARMLPPPWVNRYHFYLLTFKYTTSNCLFSFLLAQVP